MPGKKGRLVRSTGGARQSVYLSQWCGMWLEGETLHITYFGQGGHDHLIPEDGIAYDAMLMLYREGLRQGEDE